MISLDDFYQINSFVEVVPVDPFGKGIPMNKTDRNLGAELGLRHNLAPFDWTNVRLGDTDDPIVNAVGLALIHGLLLTTDFMDDQKGAILTGRQYRKRYVTGQSVDMS